MKKALEGLFGVLSEERKEFLSSGLSKLLTGEACVFVKEYKCAYANRKVDEGVKFTYDDRENGLVERVVFDNGKKMCRECQKMIAKEKGIKGTRARNTVAKKRKKGKKKTDDEDGRAEAKKSKKSSRSRTAVTVTAEQGQRRRRREEKKEIKLPFMCGFCETSFAKIEELEEHNKTCAEKIDLFACDKCEKTFESQPGLRAHVNKKHHGSGKENNRKKKSTNKRDDRVKNRRHFSISTTTFTFKKQMKIAKIESLREAKEKELDRKSSSLKAIIKLAKDTPVEIFWPGELKFFPGKIESYDTRLHSVAYDDGDHGKLCLDKECFMIAKPPWKCHVCKKSFVNKFYLRKHMYTHAEKPYFKCDMCDLSYHSPYGLDFHKSKQHAHKKELKKLTPSVIVLAGPNNKKDKNKTVQETVEKTNVVLINIEEIKRKAISLGYGIGSMKHAVYVLLAKAGKAGMTVENIVSDAQRLDLYNWGTCKTAKQSVTGTLLTHARIFQRIAPATYALKELTEENAGSKKAISISPAAARMITPRENVIAWDSEIEDANVLFASDRALLSKSSAIKSDAEFAKILHSELNSPSRHRCAQL